jgi:hypothetical protein
MHYFTKQTKYGVIYYYSYRFYADLFIVIATVERVGAYVYMCVWINVNVMRRNYKCYKLPLWHKYIS